jgi:hypothetical protein
MKQRYTSATALLLIVIIVSVLSIRTATAQSGGRLIILRSPTFGWNIVLNLKIDGRTIANVVQGHRYDHPVPPGHHVLTAAAAPNSYYSEPTSTVLNVRSGHTYVFTGAWDGSNRVVLIPSALPPGQSY